MITNYLISASLKKSMQSIKLCSTFRSQIITPKTKFAKSSPVKTNFAFGQSTKQTTKVTSLKLLQTPKQNVFMREFGTSTEGKLYILYLSN